VFLRALRMKGFKSFSRQTELVFEPGVAVVIGPNGSGKSNIADAVTWVLGEQSPTSIRGSSMQDLIFAGSDGRRAAATAEVELVFDNSDGALSVPTAEVSIGRRIVRGGETTYTINRAVCRLTDVIELTAEMGLGREMHSIIGQGKVETLLAAKPDERRALVEEAAGLGRYKRRRERSEIKLREVRRNLERARDLEREASLQLAPLRRQANAAETLRGIENELAESRGRLLTGEIVALDERLSEERAAVASVAARRAALDERLAQTERARLAEEESFARDVRERERRAGRALRARYLGDRLAGCRRLIAQRGALLDEMRRAAEAERESLAVELESGAASGEALPAGGDLSAFEAGLAAAAAAQAKAAALLAAARGELAERRSACARQELELETVIARRERVGRRRVVLEADAGRLAAEVEGNDAARAALADDERLAGAALDEAAAALAGAESAADAAGDEAARAAAALAEVTSAWQQIGAERAGVEADLEHAGASLSELREVDAEVLRVAERYPGVVELSAAVSCERGYELALAAALAQHPGTLAVSAGEDKWSVLEALRSAGVLLARLLAPAHRSRGRAAIAFPGALPLADKVTVDAGDHLEQVLAEVVVVSDLTAVPDSFEGLAVMRDGSYYRPSTGQLGLAAGVPAALVIERRARVEALVERLDALKAREARESVAAAGARARSEALASARAGAMATLEAAAAALDEARRRSTSAAVEQRGAGERARRLAEALTAARTEAESLDAELGAVVERAAMHEREAATERAALSVSEAATAAAEAAHLETLGALTRARIELDERRAREQRSADERARNERRLESARRRLHEVESRLQGAPGASEACADVVAALEALQSGVEPLIERLTDEAGEAEGRVRDRLAARRLAEDEVALRREVDELGESRGAALVAVARLEERRAEVAGRFDQVAEALEISVFEAPQSDDEAAALRSRLERLERRRDGVGPVNPLAEAECARLSEHVEFLREQRRDLEHSLDETESLIAELTQRIEVDFDETFGVVQGNFAHMVGILFPGGSGRLVTVSGEGDEPSGIAIEVKPARKLGRKLALLSGGERSLVALAFLLALLLSRTCPLYILDEVEAALDDINIGLFVSLVRDYRSKTQFLIITHQKRTMEAADLLYGVTMGPDGTSQVVSARMAEEEIDHEAGVT
jgi:chromosome segregation protein